MPSRPVRTAAGFSLVELMVAVMFIGILLAGMANVFKASVSNLTTSGESISSARRNRMSVDLLYEDLNNAGMFLEDVTAMPKQLVPANPAFYVIPNMPINGAAADDPQSADELYFFMDQALAFEGKLTSTGIGPTAANSAPELVLSGGSPLVGDSTFTIDCGDPSYAKMLVAGQCLIIKDTSECLYIQSAPTVAGKSVTVTLGSSPNAGVTGIGASGLPSKTKHIINSGVLFFNKSQMVRYAIQMRLYDPQKATGVPCLVRDQGVYSALGFVPDPAQQSVVAENVSGFKVYLSANSGSSWVGLGKTYSGFTTGWSTGMRLDLDAQLAAVGRPGFTSTQAKEDWFRSIPTLVRLDITTRTATKRSEYSAVPLATAYKDFTQSLVIVPRHFGLSLN